MPGCAGFAQFSSRISTHVGYLQDSGGDASTDSPGGNQQHVMELLRSILDTLRKQQSSIQGQEELLCELRDISSRAAKAEEVWPPLSCIPASLSLSWLRTRSCHPCSTDV